MKCNLNLLCILYFATHPRCACSHGRAQRKKFSFSLSNRDHQKVFSDEQYIIDQLLYANRVNGFYDWRVRPSGLNDSIQSALLSEDLSHPSQLVIATEDEEEHPIRVMANLYLRSISEVDDVNMEYTAHFTFRQEWIDERLLFYSDKLKNIILTPDQRIFLPDTFFQNEKNGKKHNIDKPNVLIRIYNGTGRVLYSCRLTLTLSCPMHLEAYPLDTQTCYIDYASYAYTTKDIEYYWKEDNPIQIKEGLRQSLPSFVLSSVRTGNCTSVTNTGRYSCLRTIIKLKREFSYYLLQLYVPSFMLVVVSSVSFWLDQDSVPARVTLGTTVLLTVTTMSSGINANLPPVSYTKSVDIWIGVCTGFIFGALLEFSLVNWAARKEAFSFRRMPKVPNIINGNPLLIYQHRLPMVATLANRASFSGMLPILSINNSGAPDEPTSPEVCHFYRKSYYDHGESVDEIDYDDEVSSPALPTSVRADGAMSHKKHVTAKIRCLCCVCRGKWWSNSRIACWWHDVWHSRYREKSRRIDLLARIMFPFFFIIFNIIYWTRYLRPYLAVRSEMGDEL